MKDKLWCDLHSTEEKIEFLRSGRAADTGIISRSIVQDILTAYERIVKLEKSVAGYERLLDQAYDDFQDCGDNWEVREVLKDLLEYAPRRNWKEDER
jgi:hypothetical protein